MRACSAFCAVSGKSISGNGCRGGLLNRELVAIPAMQKRLEKEYQQPISGQLLLKKIAICLFPAP